MRTQPIALPKLSLWGRYLLRLKRRRLLWRSFRARHQLRAVVDRSADTAPDGIILISVQRNEAARLPYFLNYYRGLGVSHFLFVDNASDDGSDQFLAAQDDVSLWRSAHSYRASRFGLDWVTWLQMRHGHGRWVLTADADELLVYDGQDQHDLRDLTGLLDRSGQYAFGALMLEPYPKGALDQVSYAPGQDPLDILGWFDAGPYRAMRQAPMGNLWVQGGLRERAFFAETPEKSPTLNKLPLVKWNRRFAYVNSTHSALPRRVNAQYDGPGGQVPAGVLLHSKFLPEIVSKSAIEKERRQHFARPEEFADYYQTLTEAPVLWQPESVRYTGPAQLVQLGLMPAIDWSA